MKVTILGSGSAYGTPMIFNTWGQSSSQNSKNYRTRPSIFLEIEGKNVFLEEGHPGFYNLLIDSTNTTGWYSGGDLIITDSKGEVVASIQLKTSGGSGETIGTIKRDRLNKAIDTLLLLIDQENNQFISKFYDLVKTSTVSPINNCIDQTVENIIKQNLNLTK